jgi:diguanylate cyclase (GGDEF)-like protein
VSGRLLSQAPIGEMSKLVLEHVCRLTSSPTSFVGYVDHRTGRLVAAAVTPDAGDMLRLHSDNGRAPHAGAGLWGWALENKKPILTNLPTLDPRFKGLPEWHFPVGQFLLAPAVMSETLVGLLAAANAESGYSEKDLEAVMRLAELYALAVYRMTTEEKLRDMSLEDDLTGLYNRRGFLTLAEQQFRIAHRSKKEMSLLYADLDDLKGVNDTLGHEEGDAVLVAFATMLREAFRESDIIARIGGDEFVVLAVDAGENKAEALKLRLMEKVGQWNAGTRRTYTLSVSLGTALYDPGRPAAIQDLIALADQGMYRHKSAKRNGEART